MSKIPQGEWNTIAARHDRGETIARIAQDYGCTAPAIHYILKRQKERGGPYPVEMRPPLPATPPIADPPPPERRPAAEVRPMSTLRHPRGDEPGRDERRAYALEATAAITPPASERRPEAFRAEAARFERPENRRLEAPPSPVRRSALEAGLDDELQSQAEQALDAFRVNLDAALADRSPTRRDELRAAASDLMRMAARTMIVLDRLSAAHERERPSGPAPDYPRSAHAVKTERQLGKVG